MFFNTLKYPSEDITSIKDNYNIEYKLTYKE